MNTNIYSAEVGAPATSDALPLGQSLLEQQVEGAQILQNSGGNNCTWTPFAKEYFVEMDFVF